MVTVGVSDDLGNVLLVIDGEFGRTVLTLPANHAVLIGNLLLSCAETAEIANDE